MGKVLIIGAGGVGNVVAHKCAQNPEIFSEIMLASRTLEKPERIQKEVKEFQNYDIQTARVDADYPKQTVSLIDRFKPDIVINVALPYQDLSIMDACLESRVNYLDTANYEPLEFPTFSYKWQWEYHDRFKEKGLMALLGCGFDPGVTDGFCAYAQKHLFDRIKTIDILDCNAGNHGKQFATNFNSETNIREVTQIVKYYEKGEWIETPLIIEQNSIHMTFDYPVVGKRESYLLYHEELESLVKHIPNLEKTRFWMTFTDSYLTHLRVLKNVGMTRIDEVDFEGKKIIPLRFLKSLLPDPSSLGKNYTGKTVIGCIFQGEKNGKERKIYIYNVCDHEECYKEVKSQAVSYTAGVPAMIGAMLMLEGKWKEKGVYNVEQLNPDPFMEKLNQHGLPWKVEEFKGELPI